MRVPHSSICCLLDFLLLRYDHREGFYLRSKNPSTKKVGSRTTCQQSYQFLDQSACPLPRCRRIAFTNYFTQSFITFITELAHCSKYDGVAITCSLDVAGRRAIYFPYEIWLFLNMLHRYCNFLSFSHLFPRFIILFIISSSVLEQAGFSEIEGVISSNPTWQCLNFVFFAFI